MPSLTFVTQILRDMRSQKLRTMMTLFGIVWGTAAVILLLSFGEGIHLSQQKSVHGLGEYIVIMWPGRTSKPYEGLPRNRSIQFKEEDAELLKTVPHMKAVSPEYSYWNAKARVGKLDKLVSITGCWPIFAEIRNVIPQVGSRFINEEDMKFRRRVVFLGTDLAEELFPGKDPVGEYLHMNNVPFKIVGVMKRKSQDSSYNGRDTRRTFIPSTTFKTMFGREHVDDIVFQADVPERTPNLIAGVYETLGRKHKFDPSDKEALMLWDTSEMETFFNAFFMGFRIFLGIIGAFTLIVGGIGISNIMNVVVEERTKEIGIKMALGAKKRFVRTQFICETLFLTGLGGLIGFTFSYTVVSLFPLLRLEDYVGTPIISTSVSIAAIMILSFIGLVAGYFPARRASDLNPVEALRL
jgi:putative ABC transport system permease protein